MTIKVPQAVASVFNLEIHITESHHQNKLFLNILAAVVGSGK